jgi:hypothetical protein
MYLDLAQMVWPYVLCIASGWNLIWGCLAIHTVNILLAILLSQDLVKVIKAKENRGE